MPRKPGLSLRQHEELGATLKRMRDSLLREHLNISRAYGKTHRAAEALHTAYEAVDRARTILDDHVFMENPDAGSELTKIYYPGNR